MLATRHLVFPGAPNWAGFDGRLRSARCRFLYIYRSECLQTVMWPFVDIMT